MIHGWPGWVAVLLGGTALAVTSYWHQRAGGAGTSGWVLPTVALVFLAVGFAAAVVWRRWGR